MLKNTREDFSLEYLNIGVLSKRVKVLVIGGGRGSFIKLKNLVKTKANVTVLSENFIKEIEEIKEVTKIKDRYNKDYLKGYKLVIICIDNKEVLKTIMEDCEALDKLYLNGTEGLNGDFIIQTTISTKNINIGLNTKNKNPKGSVYLRETLRDEVEGLDLFIEYTSNIRNRIKVREDKKEILDFIHSNDFKYMFDKGKGDYILKMFFENII
ncbi:MAG: NAD(P)-dependent oxidoreductase [Clostridium sp.]|uniref:NAD(P)-dependent oxidoreductase n=1 Tax=Clostridium sp. TaxID=1506 RepID=UPI003EE6170A